MKMSYWKTTVVPGFKKMFDKSGKKAAAAEACKAFADSKEGITKELEEKKPELEAKVAKIYEASPAEIKTLLKEPKASGIKKQSAQVQKFLEELAGIDFPGSKLVSEASAKLGTSSLSGPIIFVFEKVSTFVVTEKKDEVAVETTEVVAAATENEASVSTTDKEIVIEGEKKAEEEITPAAPIEEVTKTEKKVEAPEEVIITTEKKVEPVPELPVAKPVPVAEPVAVAAEPAAAVKVETPTDAPAPAAAASAPVEPAAKA